MVTMSLRLMQQGLRRVFGARRASQSYRAQSYGSGILYQLCQRRVERGASEMKEFMLNPMAAFSMTSFNNNKVALNGVEDYNMLIQSVNQRKRSYLVRDIYEDMLLDGVQPIRDTFYHLIVGCTRINRLQDVLFFFEEMKAMGLTPDVALFNAVIVACGRCNQIDRAFQVAEEMETFGIHPRHPTFMALLKACASAGRVHEAYGVVRRMAAYGLTLNNYCYSILISAHKNKKPFTKESVEKILELLNQSKLINEVDELAIAATGEAEIAHDIEDELFSLGTDNLQFRRGSPNKRLVVYHAAVAALSETGNYAALKDVVQSLENDGMELDYYCVVQLIKAHFHEGNVDKAFSEFEKFSDSGKWPNLDLYVAMLEGVMTKFNPSNAARAQKLLTQMSKRGYFLNGKVGSQLLLQACNESGGHVETSSLIWDCMMVRDIKPSFKATYDFCRFLERNAVAQDDPRYAAVKGKLEEFRGTNKGTPGLERQAPEETVQKSGIPNLEDMVATSSSP